MNAGKGDKEGMYTGGFLPQKDKLCLIEGPSMFIRSRRTRIELGAKYLGQTYKQYEQVIGKNEKL